MGEGSGFRTGQGAGCTPRPSTLEHRRPLASCSRTARQSSRGRGTKVTGAQSTLREHGLAPGALGLPVCPHSLHQCRQAGERQGWTPWGQGQSPGGRGRGSHAAQLSRRERSGDAQAWMLRHLLPEPPPLKLTTAKERRGRGADSRPRGVCSHHQQQTCPPVHR